MIYYDEKRVCKREEVGGKAFGLFSLLRMGKPVPPFFVVTAGTDISSSDFETQLSSYVERLGGERFAVRSSGVAEDNEFNSFAGQYDTLLNVEKKDVLSAVQRVLASGSGARTQAYAQERSVSSLEMAVIVQKQLAPTRAGVAFSTSPFDERQAIVESFDGQGEALVSGTITPKRFCFDKEQSCAEGVEGEVFLVSRALERALGYPLDIEWAYDDGLYFLQMRPLTVVPVPVGKVQGEWQEYVYRDFAVLNECVQAEASKRSVQEREFGFHIPVFEGLLVDGHEFYSQENDRKVLAVWESLDQADFFETFIRKIEQSVRRTKKRVRALQTLDTALLSDGDLLGAYRREMKAYLRSYLPLMMRPDEYLEQQLGLRLKKAEREELLFTVSYPVKDTYYASEKYVFLEMAIAFQDGNDAKLQAYLDKYEWMNAPLGRSFTPLTRAEVGKRLADMGAGEAQVRLAHLKKERKRRLSLRRKVLSQTDGAIKRLALLLAEFTHLRTMTTENSDRYFYYIKKKLLCEMAKRKGVSIEKLLYCTPTEVEEIFLERKSVKVGERRRAGVTFQFYENGYTMYEGNGLALLKKLLPVPNAEGRICGSVACSGCVRARVKVIKTMHDIDKLEKGEILATTMTTPELIRAMERASGIITDEGGITCHAAIIAREYAVPCLVGTGVATALLKDGMLVELDCIHGVCTIVNE